MDSSAPPDSSSAVSLTYAAIQRLARQSATCKLTSAIISGAAMLFAFSKTGTEGLLWAAAVPVGMLALADACYAAKARGFAALAAQFDGGRGPKWSAFFEHQVSGGGIKEAAQGLAGVLSLTVWPYYVALALMVGGLSTLEVPKTLTNGLNPPYTMTPSPGFNNGVPPGATFPSPQPRTFSPTATPGSFPPGAPPAGGAQAAGGTRSRFSVPNAPQPGNVSPRPPGAGGTNPAMTPPPANAAGLNRSPSPVPPPSTVRAPVTPSAVPAPAPAPAPAAPGPAPAK